METLVETRLMKFLNGELRIIRNMGYEIKEPQKVCVITDDVVDGPEAFSGMGAESCIDIVNVVFNAYTKDGYLYGESTEDEGAITPMKIVKYKMIDGVHFFSVVL